LILKKISKICATRCQILRRKCTKSDFCVRGAYSAPADPLAVFKGATYKGKEGERKGRVRRKSEGKEGWK